MSFDWLKSVSARIGIEGRNIIIVSGLALSGFGIWVFTREYSSHPLLSWVFSSAFFLLGLATLLIGLLVKPQPSEVAQKFFLQQVGQQFLYASGLQSSGELIELLQAAHNIQPLPAPSAVVKGSAGKEGDYTPISPEEAEEIARNDREGVQKLLGREVGRILSSLGAARMEGGSPKQIGAADQADTRVSEKK